MKACAGTADDEGFIKYESKYHIIFFQKTWRMLKFFLYLVAFVKNIMAGPYPEEAAK